MAHYIGYVDIPHGSYEEWKNATLNNGYDYDGWYSEQCWDYVQECYAQYGLTLYTGNGTAEGCWSLMRSANSRDPFYAVDGVTNIKKGDILVFGPMPYNYAGHICFADEDYHGMSSIRCLGQNQVGSGSGYPVTLTNYTLTYFYGIFRNKNWEGGVEPEPETVDNKHRYNFVLFNRRKRQEKWTKKPLKLR